MGIWNRLGFLGAWASKKWSHTIVSIGLNAIVLLFFWRFYRVACARANSKREFQVKIFCFTFHTYYVGIKICMQTSLYVKPTVLIQNTFPFKAIKETHEQHKTKIDRWTQKRDNNLHHPFKHIVVSFPPLTSPLFTIQSDTKTRWAVPSPYLQWLCPVFPWSHPPWPQIMVPRLPMSPLQVPGGRVHARCGWFPCLGRQNGTNWKIERWAEPRP